MPTDDERLSLLERLSDQQLNLNDQLLVLTTRLGEEHARYQERLAWYEEVVTRLDAARAQHQERMDRLDTLLQAIKDLLERGNNH
jgi:hypothetical protein